MKRKAGFTLMEAVIALAVWMILSVSVIYMWHHVSNRTNAVLERQNALENARVAMDALTVNIQMAKSVRLEVGPRNDLRNLYLMSLNPAQNLHEYRFIFDYRLTASHDRFQRLQIGSYSNHIAYYIYIVQIELADNNRQLDVMITTACEHPVILKGSVDIRNKYLYPVRRFTH